MGPLQREAEPAVGGVSAGQHGGREWERGGQLVEKKLVTCHQIRRSTEQRPATLNKCTVCPHLPQCASLPAVLQAAPHLCC